MRTCRKVLEAEQGNASINNYCLLFLLNYSAANGADGAFKDILPFLGRHFFPPSSTPSSHPPSLLINSIRLTVNLSFHSQHASDILNFEVSVKFPSLKFVDTQ